MTTLAGHEQIIPPLLRAIREGRAAHAYLISGPAQTGKGTLAKLMAAAMLCDAPDAPCGRCHTCSRVERGVHPDVEALAPGGVCDESEHDHAKDNSRDVRICQVRRVDRLLSLTPFEGRARVVIIDPAGALNAQAADAFLKTLEEPLGNTLIALVATDPSSLSETIRSRCRQVALHTLPLAAIERHLSEHGAEPAAAALLARLSGGHIGRALTALADPGFQESRATALDQIAELATSGRAARFDYAEKLATRFSRGREEVYEALATWSSWWRDLLFTTAGAEQGIINVDRREQLAAAAGRYHPADVARFLRALREARQDLESNVSPRLALEGLMLKVPSGRG